METISYKDAVFKSMHSALEKNKNAIILGLGVADHIGIFGSTVGLNKVYGDKRVFNTPLCEESFTGFALGASLAGLYPISVHIRNDFVLLAMNQIVNSISKYKSMYGGLMEAPMLIRAVIGRSWGQGAQHSQSLQSVLAHFPGLTVIMPSSSQTVLDSYDYAVNHYKSPVISLEYRSLYQYSFHVDPAKRPKNPLSSFVVREGKDVTIVATSTMVQEALRAADYVREKEGIEAEIIDLHCVSHPNKDLIFESLKKTRKLIVADTSWAEFGVCAEVSRWIVEKDPSLLKQSADLISVARTPCPTSKALEDFYYPDMGTLANAIFAQAKGSKKHGVALPSAELKSKLYKQFKGPF